MHGTDGQSNCLQGVKKPAASAAPRIYIRAAIRHYLFKADQLANEKESFAKLEIVRELTRRLRKEAGFSPWWPLGFAALSGCVLLGMFIAHQPKSYIYAAPDEYVRVLQQINAYDFTLQVVNQGQSLQPTVLHFCHDYQPLFEAGMTLNWLSYEDRGACQSIVAKRNGYHLVRGSDHVPTLAPNCHPDVVNDRVVCDGGKAQF